MRNEGRSNLRTRSSAALRRQGSVGVVRIAMRRLGRKLYRREEHIWYAVPLVELADVPLPSGCTVVRATTAEELEIASQTGKDATVARGLIEEGHDLWLARDGDVGVFTCWIFRCEAPALAARGGWFTLPPQTVAVEDAVTLPAYRGRSAAPGTVSALARSLEAAGEETLINKVAVGNSASHRAVEKLGMKPVARIRTLKVGPFRRISTRDQVGEVGAQVAAALAERHDGGFRRRGSAKQAPPGRPKRAGARAG
jgi:hypothetical protein